LPPGEIRAIEAGNPTNTKWCCNNMLEHWLEVDTDATWRMMFKAIESPAVSSAYNSDYLGRCNMIVKSGMYCHVSKLLHGSEQKYKITYLNQMCYLFTQPNATTGLL